MGSNKKNCVKLKIKTGGKSLPLSMIIQEIFNAIMKYERQIYLNHDVDNYTNGYYDRTLELTFGKLNLKIPRVRYGNKFYSSLLPEKWKRVDKEYENLLLALLSNGYSKAKIKQTLKKLNLPYSEEDILDLVYQHLQAYKNSILPEEVFALFIDAYHAKMRDENEKMTNISIYLAVAIDMEGYKQILGYWVKKGKENKSFWIEVFQDMISRGLKKVAIFVSNDFSGLTDVVNQFFPYSDHQLCWTHMKRNLRRKFNKREYSLLNKRLTFVKESLTKNEALGHWENFLKELSNLNSSLVKQYEKKTDNYLAFIGYPEEIRKHIYTSNVVESVNAGLEMMRLELGGYFPSIRTLEINLFIQLSNLNDKWMRKPVVAFRANLYGMRQILNVKFGLENLFD
ncbi:MAG TPA: IS256 family transposase [Bacteroidia bacterium]|nr:IS256 family transposase [Bacteroidia bacterium]